MHMISFFCHLYVRQKQSHGRRYRADHLIVQASRAWFVDIDRALHRLFIPFGAWMALEWNNRSNLGICISILVAFWYKNHVCEIISVYNTLTTHGRKYDVVPTSCTGGHTDIVAKLRRCRCCNKSQYHCNNHIVSLSIHERNSPIYLDGFHSPSKLTLPTSEMGSKHVVYQNILSFGEQELEPI